MLIKKVHSEARNLEILDKVKSLVEILLDQNDNTERMSIGLIGKKLGKNSLLEKHLGKIPQTKEYIEAVRESNKDFHILKIKWAIRDLDEEGQEILPWKIFRKAGIREAYQEELKEQVYILLNEENNIHVSTSMYIKI